MPPTNDETGPELEVVLLAAGYGTRMLPLTRNRPKSLLPLGGRPILDHLLDKLQGVPGINGYTVVTNDRFHDHFVEWAESTEVDRPLEILNDGTTSNENRRGALADVRFALEHGQRAASGDGIFLAATDNLPPFELSPLVELSARRTASAVFACRTDDHDRLCRSGVVQLDEQGRVEDFEEKPDEPASDLFVPPFYLYRKPALGLLGDYLQDGNDPDAPGNFLGWLIERHTVWARPVEGIPRDLGNVESYRRAQREFGST